MARPSPISAATALSTSSADDAVAVGLGTETPILGLAGLVSAFAFSLPNLSDERTL